MKKFLSLVIAAAVYVILGLISWNIVCSIIDLPSKTLIELADYRLWTYSGITFALIYLLQYILEGRDPFDNIGNGYFLFLIPLILNVVIGLFVNHWEGAWQSVNIIFTIIYNVINIAYITIYVYFILDKK
ncbi:MAG: hypothetical protein IIU55_04465 [Paludibacteraceae bacterium]|jgi:hypothetical protein|nr:hypothetical protein [Paludibacteraceae bacterium]